MQPRSTYATMPLELDVFLSREVAAADVPLTHSFGIARNPTHGLRGSSKSSSKTE